MLIKTFCVKCLESDNKRSRRIRCKTYIIMRGISFRLSNLDCSLHSFRFKWMNTFFFHSLLWKRKKNPLTSNPVTLSPNSWTIYINNKKKRIFTLCVKNPTVLKNGLMLLTCFFLAWAALISFNGIFKVFPSLNKIFGRNALKTSISWP